MYLCDVCSYYNTTLMVCGKTSDETEEQRARNDEDRFVPRFCSLDDTGIESLLEEMTK